MHAHARRYALPLGLALTMVAIALVGCPPPKQEAGSSGAGAAAGTATAAKPAGEGQSVSEGVYGDENGVPIGAYFGLTGADAAFGQQSVSAMILALEQWEGTPSVKLAVVDDRCNPADVPTCLNKLLAEDKCVAVIGEVASTLSLQGAPICQKAGVPMISPSSTNPKVTECGDFIFRTCFIDPYQGWVMAQFAMDRFQAKKAAVLYPQANAYSVGLAKYFREAIEKAGGEIVANQAYAKDQKDFRTELNMIKSKQPDVLFVPSYYTDAAMICKQARELDITIPLLGGDGWDSPKLFEIGGAATNNGFFSNHYAKDSDSEAVRQFVATYEKRWGTAPSAMAATAYDAIRIVLDILSKLPDPKDSRSIRDAIAQVKGFDGVTGSITIDAERNAAGKDAVVLEMKDGVQTYVTTVRAAK